jgi:hypothetical protein
MDTSIKEWGHTSLNRKYFKGVRNVPDVEGIRRSIYDD